MKRIDGRPPGDDVTLEQFWPLYFSRPDAAPPWPGVRDSHAILAETMRSVNEHYARETLVRGLPHLGAPALFIHGRMDPIPTKREPRDRRTHADVDAPHHRKLRPFPVDRVSGADREARCECAGEALKHVPNLASFAHFTYG